MSFKYQVSSTGGVDRMTGFKVVELTGLEPVAYTLRTYRSSQLSYSPTFKKRIYTRANFKIDEFKVGMALRAVRSEAAVSALPSAILKLPHQNSFPMAVCKRR